MFLSKFESWKMVMVSIVYIAFGAITLFVNQESLSAFVKSVGVVFIIVGGFQMLTYFFKKSYLIASDFGFSLGLLYVVAGIAIFFKPVLILENYATIFAACVILDGSIKLQYSMNLLRLNDDRWLKFTIVSAALTILATLLILFDMGKFRSYYLSMLLIADGIANIYCLIYYNRKVKQYYDGIDTKNEIIEVD